VTTAKRVENTLVIGGVVVGMSHVVPWMTLRSRVAHKTVDIRYTDIILLYTATKSYIYIYAMRRVKTRLWDDTAFFTLNA